MTSKEKPSNGTPSTLLPLGLERLYGSPTLLFAAVVVSVFLSDAIVMLLLSCFDKHYEDIHHFLDAVMLVTVLLPILFFLVFKPLTVQLAQRRRAEEELAAERNKLRGILDAIPSRVCIFNQSNGIEYANAALMKDFGPMEGLTCFDYFHDRSDACPNCRFDKGDTEKIPPWEWHSDKTGKTYEVFQTLLKNADGTIERLALMRDITARKQTADELRASKERLRALSDHLQRAREEERTAISREIHDELGQVLASVQLGVSSLAEESPGNQHLTGKIAEMGSLISGAIKTVQRISTQLRPTILDELGLADAIEWLAADLEKRTGIDCTCDILLNGSTFSKDVATAIFRICQEALTNVIRHAHATKVTVSLEERKERLVLIIRDNGRGITSEQLQGKRSLGLIGIRERAYMLGGRVRICRWLQQGTVVIAHIPIKSSGGSP